MKKVRLNLYETFLHYLMYLSYVEDVVELNPMLYNHLRIVDQMFVIAVVYYLKFVLSLLVHLELNVVLRPAVRVFPTGNKIFCISMT